MADKFARELTGATKAKPDIFEEKKLGYRSKPITINEIDLKRDKAKLSTYKGKICARVLGYESEKIIIVD